MVKISRPLKCKILWYMVYVNHVRFCQKKSDLSSLLVKQDLHEESFPECFKEKMVKISLAFGILSRDVKDSIHLMGKSDIEWRRKFRNMMAFIF